MATIGAVAAVLSIIGLVGAPLVAFTKGPCSGSTLKTQYIIGGIATFTQLLVWLPQIVLLFVTRESGSLSILGVTIQAFGGLLFAIELVLEQANFVNVLPFIAVFVECFLILGMIIFYSRRREQRDEQSFIA